MYRPTKYDEAFFKGEHETVLSEDPLLLGHVTGNTSFNEAVERVQSGAEFDLVLDKCRALSQQQMVQNRFEVTFHLECDRTYNLSNRKRIMKCALMGSIKFFEESVFPTDLDEGELSGISKYPVYIPSEIFFGYQQAILIWFRRKIMMPLVERHSQGSKLSNDEIEVVSISERYISL